MTKEKIRMESEVIKRFNALSEKIGKICKAMLDVEEDLEDLHDMAIVYGRFDDVSIPWDEVQRRLNIEKNDDREDDRDFDWLYGGQ